MRPSPETYDGNEQKADEAGLKVMGQDLSAACWQAGMGQKPASDPNVLLKACMNTWQVTRKEQTCELFYTSVRNLTPEQANAQVRHARDQSPVETTEERRAAPRRSRPGAVKSHKKKIRFLLSNLTVEIGIHVKRMLEPRPSAARLAVRHHPQVDAAQPRRVMKTRAMDKAVNRCE